MTYIYIYIYNTERSCKCINKEKCPLQEECLTTNMYKVTLTSNKDTHLHKIYYASPKPNSNSPMQAM